MSISFYHLNGPAKGTAEKFDHDKIYLGRAPTNHISFDPNDFPTVSSRHVVLQLQSDKWLIHDLGSTNGTFVNGTRVDEAVLYHGDIVELGRAGPKMRVDFGGVAVARTVVETPGYRGAGDASPAQGTGPPERLTFGQRMSRVRGRLLFMAGAGLALVEFVNILQTTYNWDRSVFNLALIVTIAAVLSGGILAYFHGEPGRQQFTLPELFLLSLVWTVSAVLALLEFLHV